MKNESKIVKLKYFLLGVLLAISLMILTGAYQGDSGRYQIAAWGADSIGYGVFVADTTTGETKIVYLNRGTVEQNHLDMPFGAFK
jgi:hypothetical protein